MLGCGGPTDILDLREQAYTAGVLSQPTLDTLVFRVRYLKREMRGNLAGWEAHWRNAELANDQLGLPPFSQLEQPMPGWRAVPISLLGMQNYVRMRANELVEAHDRDGLAFLVSDTRARYARGMIEVSTYLTDVETWLRRAQAH